MLLRSKILRANALRMTGNLNRTLLETPRSPNQKEEVLPGCKGKIKTKSVALLLHSDHDAHQVLIVINNAEFI